MFDLFTVRKFMWLLHAPVCMYSPEGVPLPGQEEAGEYKLLVKEDFEGGATKEFPYVKLEENGVGFCLLWVQEKQAWLGIGRLRIYDFGDEEASRHPYCGKDEFAAAVCILWRMITGQRVGAWEIWSRNLGKGGLPKEALIRELFRYHEEGRSHAPYFQEQREQECIRQGDLEGLKHSLADAFGGNQVGLAMDVVRQYKNQAISVISLSARSAIAGGVNPERAFSMADAFIYNIEENVSEPLRIEKAARDAELAFAQAVQEQKKGGSTSPVVDQVRDYVFCHLHEPIQVQEIAGHIGVSPNYLSEQFGQVMGMPLKQYIIREKVVASENLLKHTDYSLQEISSFCAFSSQSRFIDYFRRKNGVTPAEYRKRYFEKKQEHFP